MAAGLDRTRPELYFPAAELAIAQARASVDRLEAVDRYPAARFAVRLLVSELFTNVVKYGTRSGRARVRFVVDVRESHVRVEVGDRGRGFAPGHVEMPHPDAESGRGLAFLDALATRWGVVRSDENCVWFELDL